MKKDFYQGQVIELNEGNVYSPHFWSNSIFMVYSPRPFSVVTQDWAIEFGHVYSLDSVIFFGHLSLSSLILTV